MSQCHGWITFAALPVLVLLAFGSQADAARGRFHFVPVDAHGTVVFKPGPYGTSGERISVRGVVPDDCPPQPTCFHTYRHPCTGQVVCVPLCLPEGTPLIYHRRNRISYNYGSYVVEVHFLPDGSVDVIYSSGLFRAL